MNTYVILGESLRIPKKMIALKIQRILKNLERMFEDPWRIARKSQKKTL